MGFFFNGNHHQESQRPPPREDVRPGHSARPRRCAAPERSPWRMEAAGGFWLVDVGLIWLNG